MPYSANLKANELRQANAQEISFFRPELAGTFSSRLWPREESQRLIVKHIPAAPCISRENVDDYHTTLIEN